jgi:serine/threonine-protein kinase RsbW
MAMLSSYQERRRQEAVKPPTPNEEYCRVSVRAAAEVGRVADIVVARMAAAGYPDKDRFAVRLALEEAVANAVKHGHRGDSTKRVRVGYQVRADRVLVEVEDRGAGFDPRRVPDPRDPENLDKPSGRGLLLMRSYATWLRFNERGNRVTLCRARSG